MVETENDLFRRILLEAIDEGLLTLGKSGREAIYFHLKNSYSLKKEEIPDKPEAFVKDLENLFGLGAEVVEKAIVKNLCLRLGLKYTEKKNYSFLSYLNDAKEQATILQQAEK